MVRAGQKSVTIPEWAWDLAEQYFKKHEEQLRKQKPPIKSVSGLITSWVMEKAGKNVIILKHFNLDEHGVKISEETMDGKIIAVAEVSFNPEGIYCLYCGTHRCKHIEYSLKVPEIQAQIREKRRDGWKLPEV